MEEEEEAEGMVETTTTRLQQQLATVSENCSTYYMIFMVFKLHTEGHIPLKCLNISKPMLIFLKHFLKKSIWGFFYAMLIHFRNCWIHTKNLSTKCLVIRVHALNWFVVSMSLVQS